ncbi:sulfotransferase family protein, partial [Ideonella livida]
MDVFCIAGMHRSGTSVLARLLQTAGVSLGDPAQLMAPQADNPDGFFEHLAFMRLNRRLLETLGGDWDLPPELPTGWHHDPAVQALAAPARALLQTAFGDAPRGLWKDPRNSLTLPFWQALQPELRVIVCLRGPQAVARSLMRRSVCSPRFAQSLWERYNAALLASLPAGRTLVSHHDALRTDPLAELRRVLDFMGHPAPEDLAQRVQAIVRPADPAALANEAEALRRAGAHRALALYDALRAQAGPVYERLPEARQPAPVLPVAPAAEAAAPPP